MSQPILELRNISRVYRLGGVELRALDQVNLTIERGEFVAIMGASGSGKSTLMNVIGCLDRPSQGGYFFEGIDVAGLDEPELARIRSERVGFVFQSFNLLPRTSALENVALPLIYAASGPTERETRVAEARDALRFVGLEGREHNSPSQLSGGQQQRVAIARALINGPTVLLADEPTGNLDTRSSHEIMQMFRTLNREQGLTVIVVTHEADVAAFGDRVITMRDGQIVSDRRNAAMASEPGTAGGVPPRFRKHKAEGLAEISMTGPFWAFTTMIVAAAAQTIGRNKLRSALTTLGVFIGVAALIAMVAVGQGANEAVKRQIESLGTNLLIVVPGATTASGVRAGFGSASTLTVMDAQAILRDDPAIGAVSYVIRQLGQIQYANQNWSTSIQGVTPAYLRLSNWRIAEGRALTASDENSAAMVALIGATVRQQLFRSYENPVGAMILIKGSPMRVVGVLAAKGQSAFGQDQDDVVLIPFTSAERKVLGVAAPTQAQSTLNSVFPAPVNPYGIPPRLTGYVNLIFAQAARPELVQTAIRQITATLMRRHRIRPGDNADFAVRNLSQIAEAAKGSSRIMALLLAIVASIALLVGGIGIMNILLVSVTERTREIGLRMAIGARRVHVLFQFLVEAVLLSVAGGFAGIVGGVVVSMLIAGIAHWPTLLSPTAVLGGFLFSAAVGVFFGYYPARKASRLNPIEALRYE